MFIHENDNWTSFRWDTDKVNSLLLTTMQRLGYLAGRMSSIGFDSQMMAKVETVTNDVVASSAIEGIRLDTDEVRSSVARRLGVNLPKSKDSTHDVDGIVEMMLDATHNCKHPLTQQRLMKWHRALFPHKTDLIVGGYRKDEMMVVSGNFGRERLHYRAPSADRVPAEMDRFISWINDSNNVDGVLKSAIAHLWFVSIHPFDDGNGRIARALSDMLLAMLDGDDFHFYSLSRRILADKKHYYQVLEKTQRSDGEITEWLVWYLNAIMAAVDDSNAMLSQVLRKARFWATHAQASLTDRQRMVLNRYLDGYDAKLTAKNWGKIADVSKDTALRDIDSLVRQGILIPTPGRVRDIPYSICYNAIDCDALHFSDCKIESVEGAQYITAVYNGATPVRDRLSVIDTQRFVDGEITLEALVQKYFAYLLE